MSKLSLIFCRQYGTFSFHTLKRVYLVLSVMIQLLIFGTLTLANFSHHLHQITRPLPQVLVSPLWMTCFSVVWVWTNELCFMMYRAKSKYFVYVCNIFHHNYLRYLAIINSLSLKHSLSIKVMLKVLWYFKFQFFLFQVFLSMICLLVNIEISHLKAF